MPTTNSPDQLTGDPLFGSNDDLGGAFNIHGAAVQNAHIAFDGEPCLEIALQGGDTFVPYDASFEDLPLVAGVVETAGLAAVVTTPRGPGARALRVGCAGMGQRVVSPRSALEWVALCLSFLFYRDRERNSAVR